MPIVVRKVFLRDVDEGKEGKNYSRLQEHRCRHRLTGGPDRDFDHQNQWSDGPLEDSSEGPFVEARAVENGRHKVFIAEVREQKRHRTLS